MQFLERAFTKMGARIKFEEIVPDRWARQRVLGSFLLDVRRVLRNTEDQSYAMRNIVFLD